MAHELYVMKNGKKRNITQLVGSLSWSSNIDALGVELSFNYAYNDSKYFAGLDILELGDHIILSNSGKVLYYFVIVNESVTGRFGKSYSCFDYSWFLNKNETVIQFKKVSASQAIAKLLDKFGVKHRITALNTPITKIYKDMTVSDIIADILEQVTQETGAKIRLEMDKDAVVISRLSELVINPKVRLSSNTPAFPVTAAVSNPNRSRSIEDMKNNILVVSSDEKSTKIIAQSKDAASISKFGLMTEVIAVEKKNQAQARNIAKNSLTELNRITETVSLDLFGHDDIRAGRILKINEPITGIAGKYVIKSANHSVNNGIHLVSIELGGF